MDNFRTIAAVLVVLAAFTGFQFIANYSLRSAVRADVQRQIAQTDQQAVKHNEQLKQAYELSGSLAQSLADLQAHLLRMNDEFAATTERLGQISAKAAETAETVNALANNLDSLERKIDELKQSADAGKRAEVNLAALDARLREFEQEVSSASQNASLALSAAQQMRNDLSGRDTSGEIDVLKRNVTDLRFEFDQLASEIRKPQDAHP